MTIQENQKKPKKKNQKKPQSYQRHRHVVHYCTALLMASVRKESLECRLGEMATESVACVHNASTGASTRYPTDMISALTRLQGPIALSEKGPKKDGQLRRRR